jgi:hypothetical protein
MIAALAVYLASLLSKGIAITLPAVLVVLDIYPLNRLQWDPRQWITSRKVLYEKIPFALVALPFALLNLVGRAQQPEKWASASVDYDIFERIAQTLFGPGFFAWKTFVLYDMPPHFHESSILPSIILVLTITLSISLYILRSRWPAGLACWLYMVVSLAPVLGLVQLVPYYMADRYSYLACLSWPVLGGGMLLHFLRDSSVRTRAEKRRRVHRQMRRSFLTAAVTITTVLTVLALLTWKRTQIWRTPATLWTHILKVDSSKTIRMSLAHGHLGILLAREGSLDAALNHFQTAVKIDPGFAEGFFNMGVVYGWKLEWEKAARSFHRTSMLNPDNAQARLYLIKALEWQGQAEKADPKSEVKR